MPGTFDHVEDAIECLARHELGYILIAVSGNHRDAVCVSGNVYTPENLEWLRRRFEAYYADLRARLTEPPKENS